MPHFYRYRGDDEDLTASTRSPAPSSCSKGSPRTEEAHICCLGIGADLLIPSGDDKNKVNLNILFYELDKTIKELREDNRQLRNEVESLKSRQPSSSAPASQTDTGALEARVSQLAQECGARDERLDLAAQQSHRDIEAVREAVTALEARQAEHTRELTALKSAVPAAPTAAKETTTVVEAAADISEQVAEIKASLGSQLADFRSLVTSPLSILFDAVRSEDWIGVDSFLPFTKLNVSLGGGMDINSGKFTAPVSGLYYFSLSVYGAPRDGVVLCLKANEFQEIGSCSGVGKASQSAIVELDEKDTVGVYVNDKSKLVDTMNNRFTNFVGMLLRPRELLF